jgi:hypothetical protein
MKFLLADDGPSDSGLSLYVEVKSTAAGTSSVVYASHNQIRGAAGIGLLLWWCCHAAMYKDTHSVSV